jgi:hypothetical protein
MSFDVFKADGFSMRSLIAAINQSPYIPRRLAQLGLFRNFGVATTAVQLEIKDNVIYLVPAKPRNAPGTNNRDANRKLVPMNCLHLPVQDQIMADEVLNVREFGSETQMLSLQNRVNEKLQTIRNSFEATLEYHRMGAVKGAVLDADGTTTLYNLFTVFNVSPIAPFNFDLLASDPAPDHVKRKCSEIIRATEDELGANGVDIQVRSFVGSQFMDDLTGHPECIEAYKRQTDGRATFLIDRTARREFFYAGITFEEYRGKVGSVKFVEDGEARFYPVGVAGLFECAYGPPNWMRDASMAGVPAEGLPFEVKITPDPKGRWVDIDAQSNPLHYCTRPRVLLNALGRSG